MGTDDAELAVRSGAVALCDPKPGETGVDSERDGLQNMADGQLSVGWNSLLVECTGLSHPPFIRTGS